MRELFRAALVIARRDYVASVFSRTFLFFLIGPLLPMVAGVLIGSVLSPADSNGAGAAQAVAVIAAGGEADAIRAARARLVERLGDRALPPIELIRPKGAPDAQARALVAARGAQAVVALAPEGGALALYGAAEPMADARGALALILDTARADAALGGHRPAPVAVRTHLVAHPAEPSAADRRDTAKYGQLLLLMLTMMLAGMLLSNLIEEKSSKVIEVLAAAVPVDAIFLGKLAAMLAMSLTAIAIWGSAAGIAMVATGTKIGAAQAPAVGWVAFVALEIGYFVACYLLLGALFLGIGAQASTVREVQTLSLPVTMAQIGVFAFGVTVLGAPDSAVAKAAMLFPWSSPFAMVGRAALEPTLWAHGLALVWQAGWIAVIIRVASLRFRRSVLKSGGGRKARRATVS